MLYSILYYTLYSIYSVHPGTGTEPKQTWIAQWRRNGNRMGQTAGSVGARFNFRLI
jgi:hypothetical protein